MRMCAKARCCCCWCPAGQLYNLNSKYGNKDELVELVAAINDMGMYPVADIVINHR
jgi:alpha-amylase